MMMKESFSRMHPLVNLAFFTAVLTFSMFLMQPVCLIVSVVCALINALYLSGRRAALFSLKYLLPTAAFIVLINPLFNHRGATIWLYYPWGNPLTMESVLYGAASAALICSVALWFSCVNAVMTSDKLIYLFGRIAPALSLVLSMALRFIPRFNDRLRQVRQAQSQLSVMGKKTLRARFRAGLRVLSVMIGWSLEAAAETSDSMKSRGYGIKGRTSFSLFKFHRRDAVALAVILAEVAALSALLFSGKLHYRYFPSFGGDFADASAVVFYGIYAALMLTPLVIDLREGVKWKRLQSGI